MDANKYFVTITESPLDPAEIGLAVRKDNHGALVTFIGVTRDHTGDRKVLFLEYEAYQSMAQTKLEEIANEMCQNWAVKVSIAHRLGRVNIGEASLVVAVGSSHRKEAFDATEYSVDRIKQIVPIWKKEHFEGGEVWIEDSAGFRPMDSP